MSSKFIGAGLCFLFIFISGFWLSRRPPGRYDGRAEAQGAGLTSVCLCAERRPVHSPRPSEGLLATRSTAEPDRSAADEDRRMHRLQDISLQGRPEGLLPRARRRPKVREGEDGDDLGGRPD